MSFENINLLLQNSRANTQAIRGALVLIPTNSLLSRDSLTKDALDLIQSLAIRKEDGAALLMSLKTHIASSGILTTLDNGSYHMTLGNALNKMISSYSDFYKHYASIVSVKNILHALRELGIDLYEQLEMPGEPFVGGGPQVITFLKYHESLESMKILADKAQKLQFSSRALTLVEPIKDLYKIFTEYSVQNIINFVWSGATSAVAWQKLDAIVLLPLAPLKVAYDIYHDNYFAAVLTAVRAAFVIPLSVDRHPEELQIEGLTPYKANIIALGACAVLAMGGVAQSIWSSNTLEESVGDQITARQDAPCTETDLIIGAVNTTEA